MQANCATVHQPNNLVIAGRKRACRPLTSSKHTSHVDVALTRGANYVATLHSALLPSRRNVTAAASASPPAPATGEGQAAATDQLTTQSPLEFELACPICHSTSFRLQNVQGSPTGNLACPRCSRDFAANATCVDLTLTSGVQQRAYQQKRWGGTELFRSPLVSLAYERGWRQSFAWAGFPGVDREFELAMDFLRPAYGSVLVDMSCGSGLFSRRFLASDKFAGVIAADFSESMLQEAKRFLDQDKTLDDRKYLLLRADVARLPFATGTVSAFHAGAALHCWPDPQAALAEISRCLAPGGVFVASTFLNATAPLGQALGNDELVRPLRNLTDPLFAAQGISGSMRWWEEDEIRDLCASAGLQAFQRERKARFIMFAVTKPTYAPT